MTYFMKEKEISFTKKDREEMVRLGKVLIKKDIKLLKELAKH